MKEDKGSNLMKGTEWEDTKTSHESKKQFSKEVKKKGENRYADKIMVQVSH